MKQAEATAAAIAIAFTLLLGFGQAMFAETKVTLNDFYRPFELSEITPKNMQKWPYYRYVSMNWDEYGLFGTVHVMGAKNPAELSVADAPFNVDQELREDWTFVESLTSTQTKGFLILKDNDILGEFYDNGFRHDQTQLLQSSSKTYAGIIVSKLIDAGELDPDAAIESYLAGLKFWPEAVEEGHMALRVAGLGRRARRRDAR